ncbi:MAG: proline--tRNA ligase [Alkalispirochaetaceae bacterium]
MRYTRLFPKTLREIPKEIQSPSYRLLLKAGYIRNLGQGLFSYLPLGRRVVRNLKRIIHHEMIDLGGQEVMVPVVNPFELWHRSGRDQLVSANLARFTDRAGRELVLAPTHEEALVELVRIGLNSYRDLPAFFYQFQTKFRDEEKTRCGLVRTREFLMKDGYSFHRSFAELNSFFPRVFAAYQRIFTRCGLDVIAADAGVGYMGGDKSYEFLMPCDCGDDILVSCPNCGYSANAEVAVGTKEIPREVPAAMEEVHTSGATNMRRLAKALELPTSKLAKAMLFRTGEGFAMLVVRGDYEVSLEKASRVLGAPVNRLAYRGEVEALGFPMGYLSPLDLPALSEEAAEVTVIVDTAIADTPNLVFGANRPEHHYLNVNFGRDFEADKVADIARVAEGARCVYCDSPMETVRAMELGNIFRLGDFYSRRMELSFRSQNGRLVYPFMGSYGIGIGRLMAAVAEKHHDENGLVWPLRLAPFKVFLMAIGRSLKVRELTGQLYEELGEQCLYDDRQDSISRKFKDSDLLGIPFRVVVSAKSVTDGEVELTDRATGESRTVAVSELTDHLNARYQESD